MKEVKRVELGYSSIELILNDEPMCPYCKESNETTDLHLIYEEKTEIECDHCGKIFIYTANQSVKYDTEPYENWYLEKRERLVKNKDAFEKIENKTPWHETMIKMLVQNVEDLDKEAKEILGDQS